ncbi:MAG: hypothetical protein ACJA1A_003549 [Saprospiraceae bacterium]|jgi:hypothetical protein
MVTRLSILILFSIISSVTISQERITEIIKDKKPNRTIVKEIGSTQLLLKISPDDYLRIYEIQGDTLTQKDEKYYPDLFRSNDIQVTKNFFLTKNEKGSVAYDLRDYSEILFPYDGGNYFTQWNIKHNDFVSLRQAPSNFKRINIDLITQEFYTAPSSTTVFSLTANYRILRRWFENDEGEEDEIYTITNLNNQDSIELNTGVLYHQTADVNDHYFIYRKENQIIKVNCSDFSITTVLQIPDNQTFSSVYLAEDYSIIVTRDSVFDYITGIYNENNQLITSTKTNFKVDGFYNDIIDNHILFSGKNNHFTTLDLLNGIMKEETFRYIHDLHDLNDEYLLTYSENQIKLISKSNLSIKSRYYDHVPAYVSYISSIVKNEVHLVSFYSKNQFDNPLFTVLEDSISISSLLNDEISGITSFSDLWKGTTADKLVLIEENLYSFDELEYNQINNSPVSKLYINNSLKVNDNQICWAESNVDSQYQIKCFRNDEVIDYGIIPNLSTSSITNPHYNYSVYNDDILYIIKSPITADIELRIKKFDTGNDSLIRNFSLTNDLIEINHQAFFKILDSLYTYDYEKNALTNLGIPINTNFGYYNSIVHKGNIYLSNGHQVFRVSGLNTELIDEVPTNDYLSSLKSYGDYLSMKNSIGHTFYDGMTLQNMPLLDNHITKYLGDKHIAVYENNNLNTLQPLQIYNLETQETYSLTDEFGDRTIEFVYSINNNSFIISQNRINGLNFYSIDQFDPEFTNYTNIISFPKITTNSLVSKLIKTEEHTIAILNETIIFVDNTSGDIVDLITFFGLTSQRDVIYKDGTLYFIKFDTAMGRQLFKYNSTALNDVNYNKLEFQIYPNPTTNILTIKSPETFQSCNIFSESGKSIMNSIGSSTKADIDVSALQTGIYIVEIRYGNETATQKFIKI